MPENSFPIRPEVVDRVLRDERVDMERVDIREMGKIVKILQGDLGVRFLRLEIGIPGLPLSDIASRAEAQALADGKGNEYPPFEGIDALRKATSRFVKMFLNLDVPWHCCVATIGAMQGGFVAQAVAGSIHPDRRTIVYIDPSFPVNRLQARFLGLKVDGIDLFDHRGEGLLDALRKRFERGDVGGLLWSTPNNPSWVVLTAAETEGIARLLDRYDVIGIEDLAYVCMDFRKDYGGPGVPPYPPVIGHYGKNYITLLSGSKVFNYAGQRIGVSVISPDLAERPYPNLVERFGAEQVAEAFMKGGIYPMTAGAAQSPQHGLAALMNAACDGTYDFVEQVKEYARRARHMKETLLSNGFRLVYENDMGEPLADGFYFTAMYPGMTSGQLLRQLLRHGLSAIPLSVTGSRSKEGLRICVSKIKTSELPEFDARIRSFKSDLAGDRR